MTRLSIDGVRLSDLSALGWAVLTGSAIIAAGTVGHGLELLVNGGTAEDMALFGIGIGAVLWLVYLAIDEASPEIEGPCDNCGTNVRTQENRDGVDEVVEVTSSGTPRRATVGGFSIVLQTCPAEYLYCSGECAQADRDRRHLIERPDGRELLSTADDSVTRPTTSLTATDGGREPEQNDGSRPASRDSTHE